MKRPAYPIQPSMRSRWLPLASVLLLPGLGACEDPDGAGPLDDGWIRARAAIHMHSVHSHDACDGDPKPGGEPNAPCVEDMRRGICESGTRMVFLTDHDGSMAEVPFGELLLPYKTDADQLLGPAAQPNGLAIACPDGETSIMAPGAENHLMPVGLDRHPDVPALGASYDGREASDVQDWIDAGAVVFVSHAEEKETDYIASLPVHGIEVYNLHHNADPRRTPEAFDHLGAWLRPSDDPPDPTLALMGLLQENQVDLAHWSKLAQSRRMVGVLGHDAHQNIPIELIPGERFDSYGRLMGWFGNVLLTREATLPGCKEALREGRLYGSFDVMGTPRGFRATVEGPAGVVCDMGGECDYAEGLVVRVRAPSLAGGVPDGAEAPELTVRLLQMLEDGGTTALAEVPGDLEHTLQGPGAYRVEVRMVPLHLKARLGPEAQDVALRDLPWIYANPFYVRDGGS